MKKKKLKNNNMLAANAFFYYAVNWNDHLSSYTICYTILFRITRFFYAVPPSHSNTN